MAGGRRDVPRLQLVVKAVKPVTIVQAFILSVQVWNLDIFHWLCKQKQVF